MMHYTEAFYSIQGEGQRMGNPSVFLRMFGCNFKCQGFGMPLGKTSYEFEDIDPTDYSKFEDLPLVKTGCDSWASWDPRCKFLVEKKEPRELANVLTELTPHGNWDNIDLVITGGEPLLGWQKQYPELLNDLYAKGLMNVTFETNTTQPLQEEFSHFLQRFPGELTFSCSPKLPSSGEVWEDAINPEIALEYFNVANSTMYFKFVVGHEQDIDDVKKAVDLYQDAGVVVPIYLMPVGGIAEDYQGAAPHVAEVAMANGWRYSPRLHSDLFGNGWGT